MTAEDYGSLAELFKKDLKAKEAYRILNPSSRTINNYIFSCKLIRDNVRCASGNDCFGFAAIGDPQRDDLQKMILCITCDNIYHIRCSGINIKNVPEKQLPWTCNLCSSNPFNSAAQLLVSTGRYKLTFDERIKYFIKAADPTDEQETESDAEEIDESIHVDRGGNPIPKGILKELSKMRAENKLLQEQLLENSRLMAEILKHQSGPNGNVMQREIPQISVNNTIGLQETSYSNAILNANGASTRINDELEQSRATINAMIGRNEEAQPATSSNQNAESNQNPVDNTLRHLSKLTISELRRNLPKIEKFDGSPEKWLTFQRAVERNWQEGEYSSSEMRNQIRNALTGLALARIDSLFPLMTADQIMSALKESFGNSNIVVESAKSKLLNAKLTRPLTHASCVEVTTYIASYMAACSYAGILITDSSISSRIHSQLEPYHQQMYYDFYFKKFPNVTTRMERLDIQFEFLNSLSKTLPLGSFNKSEESKVKNKGQNNYQLMTASTSSTAPKYQPTKNDSYKYEINDIETAKYLGYDLEQVKQIPKRCEICKKTNHYSVECKAYREMKMDAKYNAVRKNNLCMNCLLSTSHQAKDCDVKNGCGFKLDANARCSGKHHVTLHRGNGTYQSSYNKPFKRQNRRSNTNHNAARAIAKVEQHQQTQNHQQSQHADNIAHQVAVLHSNVSNEILVENFSQPQAVKGYPVQPPTIETDDCKPYQTFLASPVICTLNESSHRTVKLFKTVFHGNNINATGYAMGDSAAEISLVKKELIDDLGITGQRCTIELQWTDAMIKTVDAWKVKLNISGVGKHMDIQEIDECYAVSDLKLPPRSLNVEVLKRQFPHLKHIPFESYQDAVPSILLGSTHAYMFEAIEPVIEAGMNKPVAMKTKLGFTIYGGAIEKFQSSYCINSHHVMDDGNKDEVRQANEELERLYTHACSLESLGIRPYHDHQTKEDKQAVEQLEKEMKILPNGSVEVPLVWKLVDGEIPTLPDNFAMAYKRQIATETSLKKSPELLEAYNNNFEELIKENYVRPATARDMNTEWPNKWYIPMSLVVNKNKQPVKMRNVYDASARYKGTSLNENLLMGPNLLVDMIQPLMRMRMYKYAFTADVKSMFHRVFINERDQQCQRIVWRRNASEPMQVFIQQVMLFGPKSSPFVSQFVKNKTANKFQDKYPSAARALRDFTYMDDLLSSEPTAAKAIEVSTQCIEILKSINWDLIGFQSNSLEVLRALNKDHIKQESIDIMTTEESTYTTKVLGIAWNIKTDSFVFNLNKNAFIKLVKECGHKPTKRDQCSTIARIFDILGLISHCIIRGRILLQRSWKKQLKWDDEISNDDHAEWLKWLNDLEKVSLLKIPRLRFGSHNISDASSLELHTFCDAGKEAFAAVSYLVAKINNYRYVSFVMSKAKVAPIKIKTKTEISEMPRLELLAALIAARLSKTIIDAHKDYVIESFFWSDSEIVLNWIKHDNIKLPKFAVSPVEEILDLTTQENWNYIESKNNVADIATKFKRLNFGDINSIWFQGPIFLKMPQPHWPKRNLKHHGNEASLISHISQQLNPLLEIIKLPPIDCELMSDYVIDLLSAGITSKWSKLVRAVGRALKLYYNAIIPLIKSKQWHDVDARHLIKHNNNFETLTGEEKERAELFIIRRMQREAYPVEYEKLRQGKRINTMELLQLNVFMDFNGIMRINGRVEPPKSSTPKRHTYADNLAPLVPRKSMFSTAFLFDIHYQYNHVGIEGQVAEVRSKYWMPKVRAALRRIKSMCNYCRYMCANPIEYKMSPLPNIRVDTQLKPFEVTGLDCAGPFIVYAKNGHKKKVWVLIMTCTLTRFVYLHILDNMTSLAVLEAIMVFWTSHGPVKQFISDNGSNFVGAANIIQSDERQIVQFLKETQRELEAELAEKSYASWSFIPVQSPWFGAFYERLIQTFKSSILSAIEGKKISRIEFNIALQEAAHRINCRPLTHNPVSAEEEEVLTPHHLAKNRSGWSLLPSIHHYKEIPDPEKDRDVYRRGRILADEVTKKFVKEYLPELTRRTKWFKDCEPIKTGDLVLIVNPNMTKRAWERAKVENIHYGDDNHIRIVDLLLHDGSRKKFRSVHRLAKIDIKTM